MHEAMFWQALEGLVLLIAAVVVSVIFRLIKD